MKQQKIKRIYQGRNVVTVSDAVGRDLVEEFALRPAQLKTIYNPSISPPCAPRRKPIASARTVTT